MQNQDKIISKYLSGEMSDQEREAFEKKMNEDDHLQAETELFQLEKLAFEGHLREKMWALETEYQQEQAKTTVEPIARASRQIGLPLLVGIIVCILGINSLITWLIHREFQHRTITAVNNQQNSNQDSTLQQILHQQKELQEEVQRLRQELLQGQPGSSSPLKSEKKPPVAMNEDFEDLKRQYQKAGGDKKHLAAAIEEQRTYLLTLSEGDEDWNTAIVSGNYKTAWSLLEPIVTDPQNSPKFKPSPFYYAALLKLYWDTKIDIDAEGILQQITLEQLQSDLPGFKEATLLRHRIVALYAAGKTDEANSLLEKHKKLLIKD